MEQLLVRYQCDGCGDSDYHTREATAAEVLAYAATLPGAEVELWCVTHNRPAPSKGPGDECRLRRRLSVLLPDKDTTETPFVLNVFENRDYRPVWWCMKHDAPAFRGVQSWCSASNHMGPTDINCDMRSGWLTIKEKPLISWQTCDVVGVVSGCEEVDGE